MYGYQWYNKSTLLIWFSRGVAMEVRFHPLRFSERQVNRLDEAKSQEEFEFLVQRVLLKMPTLVSSRIFSQENNNLDEFGIMIKEARGKRQVFMGE